MRMIDRLTDPAQGPLLGTWVKIPALETVELLARAGFDFVTIDLEHSPMTLEATYRATVLAQALGLHVLVRVPDRSGSHVQRILDLGADGILVPHVHDADDAAAAIAGMRFPPHGTRGLGTTSRAGTWGLDATPDYLARGEQDVLRVPQLEDPGALADAAAILDTPGLNAVFLGTGDLSLATGLPAGDPRLGRFATDLLAAAAAHAVPCGTAVRDAAAAGRAAEQGFAFVMVGNDAHLFGAAARQLCHDARTAAGP